MNLHPATLAFLETINEKNSREFFATVKDLYLEIWKTINELCAELIEEAILLDPSHAGLKPRDCLFRIYRDARRLTEGDQIYKQNFGFSINPDGKRGQSPSYYFHIEGNGLSFFGGGLYWPTSEQLLNLRYYLEIHGDEYTKILAKKELKKAFGDLTGESLKKRPRGFTEDTKHIDLLKMKQHLLFCPISDAEIIEQDISKICKDYMRIMEPWMNFLRTGCEYNEWRNNESQNKLTK